MRFPIDQAQALRRLLRGDMEPDWPDLSQEQAYDLLRLLDAHGVLGLVHARVRAGAAVPPLVAAGAARAAMAIAAHGALLLDQLDRLLGVLAAAGERGEDLPVLVLKGPALARTVYDGPSERPFGDLDLLVPEASLAGAASALEQIGYRIQPEETPDLVHHWTLVGRAASGVSVRVELHRRLLATPPFDRAFDSAALVAAAVDLPRRVVHAKAGDGARGMPEQEPVARTTDAVDTLLHLAGHLVLQHAREERLIWVADIDRVVRRGLADDPEAWSRLSRRASESGLAPSVENALRVAKHWFGTPIPDAWEPGPISAEARAAHLRVRGRAAVGQEGARLLTDALGLPGWRARAAFAWRHLLPSRDYMRAWYGIDQDWRLPIYYGRRLMRGLGHIFVRPGASGGEREAAIEPPEQWMIEHERLRRS